MPRRSIRFRRTRRRGHKAFELQLTSMMDILTIILIFLLKSYSTTTNRFTSVAGMQLPISMSPDSPPDSLQVIVTPEAITFEETRVIEFVMNPNTLSTEEAKYQFRQGDLDEGGRRIVPLYDVLQKAKDQSELLRAQSPARDAEGKPLPFHGILAIQADRRVPYDTIRKIMYTAATAGYRTFRFLAMKRDS